MYIMGIDPTTGQTSAQGPAFRVGSLGAVVEAPSLYTAPMSSSGSTAGTFEGPKVFVYVSAGAGITAGQALIVSHDGEAVPATATLGAAGTGTGKRVAVATCDIDSGGYGWVQVYGNADVNAVASTALHTKLSLSATAGSVDDLATTGSIVVDGMYLDALSGTSGHAFLNWPVVGAPVPA